jgi:hypothetical protein
VANKPYFLQNLFPGSSNRVHAVWFSGILRLPRGKVVQHILDYGPTSFEKELHIHVKQGEVIGEALVENPSALFWQTATRGEWVPLNASNVAPQCEQPETSSVSEATQKSVKQLGEAGWNGSSQGQQLRRNGGESE